MLLIYTVKNYIVKENGDRALDDFEEGEEILMLTENEKNPPSIRPSKKFVKMTKKDYIIMLVITLVYSVIALYNLGDMEAPENGYSSTTLQDTIILELPANSRPDKLVYYNGNYEGRNISLELGNESEEWLYTTNFEIDEVFCWNSYDINIDDNVDVSTPIK